MTWVRRTRARHGLGVLAIVLIAGAGLATRGLRAADSRVADAAQNGDLAAVRALILKHADVNMPQSDGSTALLWAAYNGDAAMTKALLAAHAKVDEANHYGLTPLVQASRNGALDVMEALVKAGADPRLSEVEGETPLMAAARAGSVDGVKLLVAHGADVNMQDAFHGQTALMWAAAEGQEAVVNTLLDLGANPDLKAHVTTVTERKLSDFPTGGFTALIWAARNGNSGIVRTLIARGANPNLLDGDGASAMSIAIYNDRFDMAKQLLDLGADPNAGSPLFFAVDMHDATIDMHEHDGSRLVPTYPNTLTALDLVKLLLDRGADPNKPFVGQLHSSSLCCGTYNNGTPFYRAAIASDVAAMKLLIDYGADIEWSPVAIKGGGRGANANVGKSPMMVTMTGGRGAPFGGGPGFDRPKGPIPWREVSDRKPVDAMKLLLDAGADPDAQAADGSTALHEAANNGNLQMIRLLADYGANLEAKNKDGRTALDVVEKKIADAKNPKKDGGAGGMMMGPGRGPRGAKPEQVAKLLRELMGLPPAAVEPAAAASDTNAAADEADNAADDAAADQQQADDAGAKKAEAPAADKAQGQRRPQ